MKSVEFCYWLQGMFELANPTTLTAEQTDLIRKHLARVVTHEIDLDLDPDPEPARPRPGQYAQFVIGGVVHEGFIVATSEEPSRS